MYKAILIDDEYLIRKKFRDIINWKNYGFKVVADFEDGRDAMNFLRDNRVDLIITDIRMISVSGISVAEYVHKHYPETVVVFLSGYNEVDYAKFGMQYGVKKYLNKPISKSRLCEELEDIRDYLDNARSQENSFDFSRYTNFFSSPLSGEEVTDSAFIKELIAADYHICIFDMIVEHAETNDKITKSLFNIFRLSFVGVYFFILYHDLNVYRIVIFSKEPIGNDWAEVYRRNIEENLMLKVRLDNIRTLGDAPETEETEADGDKNGESAKTNRLVRITKEYINSHLSENISLDRISKEVYVSPYYISKLFKRVTGENISEYIMRKRVDYAKKLLLTTDLSIKEVMYKVGYTAEPYFYHLFKKLTGVSPTQFRNNR